MRPNGPLTNLMADAIPGALWLSTAATGAPARRGYFLNACYGPWSSVRKVA